MKKKISAKKEAKPKPQKETKPKAKEVKKAEEKSEKPEAYRIEITFLKKAPSDKEFVLVDGRKLKDIRELAFALGDMADSVFWHHVNDAKNDFVNWVNDVLEEKELAETLKSAKDKINAQVVVLKHIVNKI